MVSLTCKYALPAKQTTFHYSPMENTWSLVYLAGKAMPGYSPDLDASMYAHYNGNVQSFPTQSAYNCPEVENVICNNILSTVCFICQKCICLTSTSFLGAIQTTQNHMPYFNFPWCALDTIYHIVRIIHKQNKLTWTKITDNQYWSLEILNLNGKWN